MKFTITKIIENNYLMAIISIVLIVVITLISLNISSNSGTDVSGKAYESINQNFINNDNIIKIEKNSDMIKIYKKVEPERYSYLRKNKE